MKGGANVWRNKLSASKWLFCAAFAFALTAAPALAQMPRTVLYYCFVPGVGYVPVYASAPAAPVVRAAAPDTVTTYGAAPKLGEPSYYTEDNPRAEAEKPDRKLPARIRVRLPVNAEVTINGKQTTSTGAVREYETPELNPERVYTYLVKAKWFEDGMMIEKSLRVRALSGNRVTINFVPPAEERPQPLRVPNAQLAVVRDLAPLPPTTPAQWAAPLSFAIRRN